MGRVHELLVLMVVLVVLLVVLLLVLWVVLMLVLLLVVLLLMMVLLMMLLLVLSVAPHAPVPCAPHPPSSAPPHHHSPTPSLFSLTASAFPNSTPPALPSPLFPQNSQVSQNSLPTWVSLMPLMVLHRVRLPRRRGDRGRGWWRNVVLRVVVRGAVWVGRVGRPPSALPHGFLQRELAARQDLGQFRARHTRIAAQRRSVPKGGVGPLLEMLGRYRASHRDGVG